MDVREFRDAHASAAEAADRLLGLRSGAPTTDAEVADSLLGAASLGRPYAPSDASLGSILGGDGLGAISDASLRVELTRWRQLSSNLAALSSVVHEQLNDKLVIYLDSRVPWRDLDRSSGAVTGLSPSGFPSRTLDFLDDVEFENALYNRYFIATQAVEASDSVYSRALDIASLLLVAAEDR